MSGPFGVSITIISGQKFSREIVVAACTFLSMGFLSIRPIGKDGKTRQEFLKVLDIFANREGIFYRDQPDYFAKQLIEPDSNISTKDLFWLALDREGESIAKDIFSANGDLPDKTVYRLIHKLNLIEQTISPPPQTSLPSEVWQQVVHQSFSASLDYHKLKTKTTRRSHMNEHAPLTPEVQLYYDWLESLYECLIPWQDAIKNIQSDFS